MKHVPASPNRGFHSTRHVLLATRHSPLATPLHLLALLVPILLLAGPRASLAEHPDYATDIQPILEMYCAACHNEYEAEGGLSLDTFNDLQRGGSSGLAVVPGQPDGSLLLRVITGEAEPQMPPEGMIPPDEEEIELLRAWIEGGAVGPDGMQPDRTRLITPKIDPAATDPAITALAWSPDGSLLAVAHFGQVELRDAASGQTVRTLTDLPGKVNAVEFSNDGSRLITASGITGLYGLATIWSVSEGEVLQQFQGHRDILYAATLSPDGKILATAGYGPSIKLWDVEQGEVTQEVDAHNGAIYDLAFSPDGTTLASASADESIKLWRVDDGIRLDTLSQPTAEQYTVCFSPDGRYILAGGEDNRIRVWRWVSRERPQTNPLLHSRFAHEAAVVHLAFSHDGGHLISVADDRLVKLWETGGYMQVKAYDEQPDLVASLAVSPVSGAFWVGRMDGTVQQYLIEAASTETAAVARREQPQEVEPMVPADETMHQYEEKEPNSRPEDAQPIEVPATVSGVINPTGDDRQDVDFYRFRAKEGEQWMIEIDAARSGSPLDSKVEVLDSQGNRIVRVLLQAVRDSYFTFRGKDSHTSDDFRLHNWEEMELNEYLYANGEVVKLWMYPRGPDSGFMVYPGSGARWGYFDTTPMAHALNAPCYIVRPYPPGSEIIPNGLPVFPIYYENDEESRRRFGTDSLLEFTAPEDGEYLIRVSDVRGFSGDDYRYRLIVRPPQPDFRVTLHGADPKVPDGGAGREFHVEADRIDGFDGPIQVELENVPDGFYVSSPLVIEREQIRAYGVIQALPGAKSMPEDAEPIRVTASAEIRGQTVAQEVNSLGRIELADPPPLAARVIASSGDEPVYTHQEPLELTIRPGETITARVLVERRDFDSRIEFGHADSGRNMPHGVYVDNIGLNGLLIPEGQTEREVFITAAPWVPETTRLFHLRAGNVDGGVTTLPVLLHVRQEDGALASRR